MVVAMETKRQMRDQPNGCVDAGLAPDFDAWHAQVEPVVRRFVQRRVTPDSVEDVVAATLGAAWRRAQSTQEVPTMGWLMVTARHKAADHWRSEYRVARLAGRAASLRTSPAVEGPEAMLDDWSIRETLDALPERYQVLLELRYLEGRSQREVAALTDQSERAVESALARARRHFRELHRTA